MRSRWQVWRKRAKMLKSETYALYLAYRHPRVPWYAKIFTACILAYAFSPVDLIPDFVPVLGYLDDVILLPLAIHWALKMIPPDVLEESRARAREIVEAKKPMSWVGGAIIIAIWLMILLGVWFIVRRMLT